MNLDLFDDHPTSDISWHAQWLGDKLARDMHRELLEEVAWQQDHLSAGGVRVPLPRLTAWQGEPDAVYVYSGIRNVPKPWTPTVVELRELLQVQTGVEFNSVLLNRYRDGTDSIGWHSDNEPELGEEPVIASVSFGATRTFEFRHRRLPTVHYSRPLFNGSLLVMRGKTQLDWAHRVPKEPAVAGERLNLTFRRVSPG